MTEEQKKDYYRKRVERDLAGNPNMPQRKKRATRFPPPSEEDKERMKYLDGYGNPIKGYKWEGNKIVKDENYTEDQMVDVGIRVKHFKGKE